MTIADLRSAESSSDPNDVQIYLLPLPGRIDKRQRRGRNRSLLDCGQRDPAGRVVVRRLDGDLGWDGIK